MDCPGVREKMDTITLTGATGRLTGPPGRFLTQYFAYCTSKHAHLNHPNTRHKDMMLA